jgi:thiol:disulfide interchange protein
MEETTPEMRLWWYFLIVVFLLFTLSLWVTRDCELALVLTMWVLVLCGGVILAVTSALDKRAMSRKKAREEEEARKAFAVWKSQRPAEDPMANTGNPHPRGYGGS